MPHAEATLGLVTLLAQLLGLTVVLVAASTAAVRLRRHRELRRRRAAEEVVRPLLLQALDDEPDDPGPRPVSPRIEAQVAPVLDAMAVGLAVKLRGADRQALIAFLDRRGTLDRARRRTRAHGVRRRLEAVETLGGLGAESGVADLVARLRDTDAEVRRSAVRALGRTVSPRAVPVLLGLLDAPARGRGQVPAHYVTMALLRIGTAGQEQLHAALGTQGPRGRAAAAAVLGWLGEPASARPLTPLLHDPDAAVRAAAVEALGRIGLPTAREAMGALLAPGQPHPVRAAAAVALGRLGDPQAADDLAAVLETAMDHELSRLAAQALARLGEAGRDRLLVHRELPEVREVLAPTGPSGPDADLRELTPA